MFERKSLKWPILLAVTMIVLLVFLTVGWILINVFMADWTLLSIGSVMFACVVVGVVLYLVLSIQQINLNRRQSNFIDSVTHELKSPIASLKLYLQTLDRRSVAEEQRQQFYQAMLDDVDRLDQLISKLLDVARLSHQATERPSAPEDVRIDELIAQLVVEQTKLHGLESGNFTIALQPATVHALNVDLEILFRNVIDNACKYAGKPPQIDIRVDPNRDQNQVTVSISDNGPGIPRNMRRRVFRRFFRIGNELERQQPGTGLGLFLAKSVVERLRGKIEITDSPQLHGTRFQIILPLSDAA